MDKIKRYGVTNDLMFRHIFGRIGNEGITKNFLESILETKILNLSLDVNKIMSGKNLESKTGIIDVKAVLKDGTKVLIEMQRKPDTYIINRTFVYAYNLALEGVRKGKSYKEMSKVIAILVTDYNLEETKAKLRYHHIYKMIDTSDSSVLTRQLELHIIELKKFKEIGTNKEKEEWIAFLRAKKEEDMAKIATKNDWLERAIEEYNYLEANPARQEEFEEKRWELIDIISMCEFHEEKGEKRGEQIGIKKGINKMKTKIILSMSENGLSLEQICKVLKLNKKEVKDILDKSLK